MSTGIHTSAAPAPKAGQGTGAVLLALLARLHFYIGVFVGPFIFIAALTGTIFVLTPQLEPLLYAGQLRTLDTQAAGAVARPLAEQVEVARAYVGPGPALVAIRPAPEPGDTSRIMFTQDGLRSGESRAVFVDPVNLTVQGDLPVYGTTGTLPLRTTLDRLHRDLLLGEVGRNYSELAASWLWLATLGGIVLWCAGKQRNRRALAARSPRLRARRLHGLIGVCVAVGLVFASVTGLTWSRWAGDRIGSLRQQLDWVTPPMSTRLPALAAAATLAPSADAVLAAARRAGIDADWIEMRAPRDAGHGWLVRELDRAWPTNFDSVVVDPRDMSILARSDFASFPLVAKLIRWGIDAHMGILFGVANQIVMAAFGIALCAMVVLGYIMWWRRRPAAAPVHAPPLATLAACWRRLPATAKLAVLALAAMLGWSLPLMGASLLVFLCIDALRTWRLARQFSSRPAPFRRAARAGGR
jgi:uncharacterized iron-regulated membrane protein